jgi:hypothetical protein
MAIDEMFSGGCACGDIRYRVSGPPVMVEYCHCDDCRKSSGSAVAALAGFRQNGFEILDGLPHYYDATSAVKRSFCGNCGSPLFYQNQDFPEDIYIHLGSFDQPEALPPDRHVWVSERIPWHKIKDGLPQYDQFSGTGLPEGAPPYKKLIET